jgi:ParB family transcriptional regulator, chromosome partitioning protein
MSKVFSTSPLIMGVIDDVNISQIRQSEHNYRDPLNDIEELVKSIREKGLLQPILVRTKDEHYEIIAGHRRYQACKYLGWRKIICHILEIDDKDAFEISLIENIQRKSLDPLEEAHAFKEYVSNFGWGGMSDLATRIGKSTSYVDRRIRLLDLPIDVLSSTSKSLISTSIAEELLSIKDQSKQSELARLAHENKLSSRQIRELIKDVNNDSVYDYDELAYSDTQMIDIDKKTQRWFDKSIIALRVAMNKLGSIIEDTEDNWIIYEILMHHKNMLHEQIDLLLKEKNKM